MSGSDLAASVHKRLLDAAEAVVLRARNPASVSVRQVAAEAGVSVSVISYHFGSFEDLMVALAMRAYRQLNQERMAVLQAAIDRHRPEPPPVREILAALVGPPVRWALSGTGAYAILRHVYAIMVTSAHPRRFRIIEASVEQHMAIVACLTRRVPWLSEAEIGWRVNAILGIRTQVLRTDHSALLSRGRLDLSDPEAVIDAILDIAEPMFAEPRPGEGPKRRF